MIEYLSFEMCKPNNASRYIKIEVGNNEVYLTEAYGSRGMYLEESVLRYCTSIQSVKSFLNLLNELKISSWPKAFPEDYVPSSHLLGCDVDSWSIDYRELGKKRTRHIHGKGLFPDNSPYNRFLEYIDCIVPEQDWLEWIENDNN
ncbi:MAG: hypothetical protein K6E47_09985 [Lachnospiraceae bacterium]|nr:hypothetical protein [Lachnospiraceae bacterium]